ncbi:MAG: DUF5916 domain-containing protein [Bacteroidota bacterium]
MHNISGFLYFKKELQEEVISATRMIHISYVLVSFREGVSDYFPQLFRLKTSLIHIVKIFRNTMRLLAYIFLTLLVGFVFGYSNPPEFVKQISAVRVKEHIKIDGVLSESVWHRPGTTAFFQQEPNQGQAVSESTEVWVAYDDEALYIAARMHDAHPDSIIARLARRDNDASADEFAVGIDSYHDKRNGYYFIVSAAGVLRDGILYNDDWSDGSWDGVWEAKPKITSDGWCVEMKIPFSQLRFEQHDQYIWGIDFERVIARKKEQSYLVYTPRNESGSVSRYPDLIGIEHITPPTRLEITPYITGRAEYAPHDAGDPFNSGSKYTTAIGADLKWGLGTNVVLEGTINPDFGQVEVDPAVVNLSDAETYFNEKRPFFLEGMNIFSFGQGGVNNYWSFNWSSPSLFYSRRIGRTPQRGLPDYDYADVPLGTHILGAAKITGKVIDGWNVGVIEAVTKREYAQLDTAGTHWSLEVEPMTTYTVARIQRDFNDGRQGVGLLVTSVNRFFDDVSIKTDVNENSYVAAFDGWTALDTGKVYMISGWAAASNVQGTRERMINLQKSSTHYFQRPDRDYISLDSSATSLSGYAGRFYFNKQKGNMILNAALGFISPGFESGDLGYLTRTDLVNYHVGTGYKWSDPTQYYRYVNIYGSIFSSFDFSGEARWRGAWCGIDYQLPSYDYFGLYYDYGFKSFNNIRTRGGPKTLNPDCYEWSFNYSSDSRNKYVFGAYWYEYEGDDAFYHSANLSFTMRPVSSVSISFGPAYTFNLEHAHWIGNYNDPLATTTYGNRYIFADLVYKELSAQIRVDWTLTPTLSFQLFAQPFISSGDFTNFKELARARSFDFLVFGKDGSTIKRNVNSDGSIGSYDLDPDGSGLAPLMNISNPNFNFVSLRGNAVLRWEYMPGSTLFLVWTQSRSDNVVDGAFNMGSSFDRLGSSTPDNIFMLKLTYWLGR